MRKLIWLFLTLSFPLAAQVGYQSVRYVAVAPSGTCSAAPPIQVVISTGAVYTCNNGTWAAIGGSGTGTGYVFVTTQTVVGSSTSALTFSSIPQTATDLECSCTGSLLSAVDITNQNMTVNNDTANHYNYSLTTNYVGTVGGAGSGALVGNVLIAPFNGTSTTGTSSVKILIPQYRNTTLAYKTFSYKGGTRRTNDAFLYDGFAYWNSNAAITRIDITDSGGGNYAAGTTCTLRGLP